MAEAEAGAAILGLRLNVLPSPVSAATVHKLITGLRLEVVLAHPLQMPIPIDFIDGTTQRLDTPEEHER